jgi:type IV secretion system protein VirB5
MPENHNQDNNPNPFLEHIEQDEWNELQAYHIEKEVAWRNIAYVAILALLIVSVLAMYYINQDKHKTLVFEKDSMGNITFLGLANKTLTVDNKIVAHQLANFIVALREVPHDLAIKRRNIELVHKMIDTKLQASVDKRIIAQYTKAANGTIVVDILSVRPLSAKSWIINWQEHLENGETSNWGSTVSFERLDTVEPSIQLLNPIGLFITDINPTEDINDK